MNNPFTFFRASFLFDLKTPFRFRSLFYTTFLLLISVVLGGFLGQNFSGPMIGGEDIDQYEFVEDYFYRNLHFTPLPQLDLTNNDVLYPYGTDHVFVPWSWERDYFYALFHGFFDHAPLLQIYYVFTLIISAVGSFLLLHRDYSPFRSFVGAVIVTFFNFYAIFKYPVHLGYTTIQYTTLSIVIDFLLVKRFVQHQPFSLRFVLLWMLIHLLALGQEPAYTTGYSLTSATLTIVYLGLTAAYRMYRGDYPLLKNRLVNWLQAGYQTHRDSVWLLLGMLVLFAYLYIPLSIEIFLTATKYNFKTMEPQHETWAHPLRLLIPHFPGFNTFVIPFSLGFNNVFETYGAGSPGWFVLLAGITGLWYARRQYAIFIPILVLFILCLFYHPNHIPTLKIFPWFVYHRNGERSTMIYPVIFGLMALYIPAPSRSGIRPYFLLLLAVLASVEAYTAYRIRLAGNALSFQVPGTFYPYMELVRQQPGEAVLDWPFCIVGGNGTGPKQGLCPYYSKTASISTYRRYHGKKTVGHYYGGRLHTDQIQSFVAADWSRVLPGSCENPSGTGLCNCQSVDWSYLAQLYHRHDFAGINLYPDVLDPACVQEIYKRFGRPIAETQVPKAGRVQFIPRKTKP
ncbi:hypothetical protein [Larkinella arboricola]